MAKESRSRKQPAFDPSELSDLIFSPAVGSGVGSHLIIGQPSYESSSTENVSSVASKAPSTVDESNLSTVGKVRQSTLQDVRSAAAILGNHAQLLELTGSTSSVDRIDIISQSLGIDVEEVVKGTLNGSKTQPNAADSKRIEAPIMAVPPSVPLRPLKTPDLWITEQGDLISGTRVKRIRLAQDTINSTEESVYDTLWSAKSVSNDDRDSSRVVQAGYDYLVKRTRLSKRTVQRIVEKLIDKDFIAIERTADIYLRTSTVYRVFAYKTILDKHLQKGRLHVAKLGPGFSYVRALQDLKWVNTQLGIQDARSDMSTVASSLSSTVDTIIPPTAATMTTGTVGKIDLPTVDHATTTYIDKDQLEHKPSSSAIYHALTNYGAVDDEVVNKFMTSCKLLAPDCTDEEVIHFINEKGSLVRMKDSRIYSPIGFLLTAVPRCLCGEAFRLFREQQRAQRKIEADHEARRKAEIEDWRAEQKMRLSDPKVSEKDKQFIRECLGIDPNSTHVEL